MTGLLHGEQLMATLGLDCPTDSDDRGGAHFERRPRQQTLKVRDSLGLALMNTRSTCDQSTDDDR